jgi:hypothetical protein
MRRRSSATSDPTAFNRARKRLSSTTSSVFIGIGCAGMVAASTPPHNTGHAGHAGGADSGPVRRALQPIGDGPARPPHFDARYLQDREPASPESDAVVVVPAGVFVSWRGEMGCFEPELCWIPLRRAETHAVTRWRISMRRSAGWIQLLSRTKLPAPQPAGNCGADTAWVSTASAPPGR